MFRLVVRVLPWALIILASLWIIMGLATMAGDVETGPTTISIQSLEESRTSEAEWWKIDDGYLFWPLSGKHSSKTADGKTTTVMGYYIPLVGKSTANAMKSSSGGKYPCGKCRVILFLPFETAQDKFPEFVKTGMTNDIRREIRGERPSQERRYIVREDQGVLHQEHPRPRLLQDHAHRVRHETDAERRGRCLAGGRDLSARGLHRMGGHAQETRQEGFHGRGCRGRHPRRYRKGHFRRPRQPEATRIAGGLWSPPRGRHDMTNSQIAKPPYFMSKK